MLLKHVDGMVVYVALAVELQCYTVRLVRVIDIATDVCLRESHTFPEHQGISCVS